MNVSADAAVALPTRLRPTPDQVCNWYARTLMAIGAEVERTGPDQLTFTLPLGSTFFDTSLAASLAPLAGGELEVSETSNGFEVSVSANARSWVGYLPIGLCVLSTGGLALGTPVGYVALIGLGLLGFTWIRTWGSLNRFLNTTNDAIADSFATVPPAPHGAGAGIADGAAPARRGVAGAPTGRLLHFRDARLPRREGP